MVPSKAFFYLAVGSALIAIANEPSELSDLLDQAEVGLRAGPWQPFEARRISEQLYSCEGGVEAFARIFDRAGLGAAAESG